MITIIHFFTKLTNKSHNIEYQYLDFINKSQHKQTENAIITNKTKQKFILSRGTPKATSKMLTSNRTLFMEHSNGK